MKCVRSRWYAFFSYPDPGLQEEDEAEHRTDGLILEEEVVQAEQAAWTHLLLGLQEYILLGKANTGEEVGHVLRDL